MLTNAQMKPNRFARWAKARKRYNFIINQVHSGRTIVIASMSHHWKINAKNVSAITMDKSGVYLKGNCIGGCTISVLS